MGRPWGGARGEGAPACLGGVGVLLSLPVPLSLHGTGRDRWQAAPGARGPPGGREKVVNHSLRKGGVSHRPAGTEDSAFPHAH